MREPGRRRRCIETGVLQPPLQDGAGFSGPVGLHEKVPVPAAIGEMRGEIRLRYQQFTLEDAVLQQSDEPQPDGLARFRLYRDLVAQVLVENPGYGVRVAECGNHAGFRLPRQQRPRRFGFVQQPVEREAAPSNQRLGHAQNPGMTRSVKIQATHVVARQYAKRHDSRPVQNPGIPFRKPQLETAVRRTGIVVERRIRFRDELKSTRARRPADQRIAAGIGAAMGADRHDHETGAGDQRCAQQTPARISRAVPHTHLPDSRHQGAPSALKPDGERAQARN